MDRRRLPIVLLVLVAFCIAFVPVRSAIAEEQTTHIEGTVSFDDNDNSRGLRPDRLPIIVATRVESDKSYSYTDFGDTRTEKLCYVSASTGWKYDADVPTHDADGNALVPVIAIVYSPEADESDLPPYAVTKNGYDFKLSYRPLTFDIPITIKWNDENNKDGIRPSSLRFSINFPNSDRSMAGMGVAVWKNQGDNTDSVTNCAFKNQHLYSNGPSYDDRFGNYFSVRGTFADWTVSAALGDTVLNLGGTVEANGYSYTMSESLNEDNVPCYEIVAVHEPKKDVNQEGGQTKPDDSKKDNVQIADDKTTKAPSTKNAANGKAADSATTRKSDKASLPNTGDFSTVMILGLVLAGVAVSFCGIWAMKKGSAN